MKRSIKNQSASIPVMPPPPPPAIVAYKCGNVPAGRLILHSPPSGQTVQPDQRSIQGATRLISQTERIPTKTLQTSCMSQLTGDTSHHHAGTAELHIIPAIGPPSLLLSFPPSIQLSIIHLCIHHHLCVIHPSIFPPIQSIYLSIIHLSSSHPALHPFVHLCIHPCFHPPFCLSIHPSDTSHHPKPGELHILPVRNLPLLVWTQMNSGRKGYQLLLI